MARLNFQDAEIIQRALKLMIDSYKNLREIPIQDALAVNGFLKVGYDELPEGMTESDFRLLAEMMVTDFEQVSSKVKEIYGV